MFPLGIFVGVYSLGLGAWICLVAEAFGFCMMVRVGEHPLVNEERGNSLQNSHRPLESSE